MVMKQLAALAGVVALALALLEPAAAAGLKFSSNDLKSEKLLWRLYERWGKRYNVARKPAEKLRRFATFNETAHRVASRVQVAGQAPGLNIFADVTNEEFSRNFLCHMTTEQRNLTARPPRRGGNGTLPLPVSVNWRNKTCEGQPCLGPVKFMGSCGSCWAFAATGALESHRAIAGANYDDPVLLSEQELVDCDPRSKGCKGGLAVNAFQYVMKNGLATSTSYPYTGVGNGTCHANTTTRASLIMRGFERLPPHDKFQLLSAVTYGPVAVSIAVTTQDDITDFMDYDGGMYRGKCGTTCNHAMLLVGYGADYYILKNSYGRYWGDEGYLFLPRDRNCGMLNRGGSYPLMGQA
uniref:Peptidase C1A papain C-terminal domain-containing protein n=1 Tax=Oryza glumipatula TaxID=40148 RepID=A0A0D9Z9X0_9ORYZ